MDDNVLLLTACLAFWALFKLVMQARHFPLHSVNHVQCPTGWILEVSGTVKGLAYYVQDIETISLSVH